MLPISSISKKHKELGFEKLSNSKVSPFQVDKFIASVKMMKVTTQTVKDLRSVQMKTGTIAKRMMEFVSVRISKQNVSAKIKNQRAFFRNVR